MKNRNVKKDEKNPIRKTERDITRDLHTLSTLLQLNKYYDFI